MNFIRIQINSNSLLSGYLADLDSTGQYSGFGDGGGSENSVEGPAPNIAVAAIVSEDLEIPVAVDDLRNHAELIADSEQVNIAIVGEILLEGDNSTSAPFPLKEKEEIEDEQIANLRRKRTEAELLDGKKRKF